MDGPGAGAGGARRRRGTRPRPAALPGDGGAVGLVAVDEDFFLIIRVAGPTTRVLLSDITAADEWELASPRSTSWGSCSPRTRTPRCLRATLDLLGDLGMHAMDMGCCSTTSTLPRRDAVRRRAPAQVGELFDDAIGLTSA